jgi:hypothetical protein
MKISLRCTMAQFDGLQAAIHGTRATSRSVTVDKAALQALIADHAKVLGEAQRFVDIDGIYAPATRRKAPLEGAR